MGEGGRVHGTTGLQQRMWTEPEPNRRTDTVTAIVSHAVFEPPHDRVCEAGPDHGVPESRPASRKCHGMTAPSSSSIVAVEGPRSRWSRRAVASASRITRNMFSPASLRRSLSLQPRRDSSAKRDG